MSFRDRYNNIIELVSNIAFRSNRGDIINVSELQRLINNINSTIEELPVGTPQQGVPENAYNNLINLRDQIQERINRHYSTVRMRAGRKMSKRSKKSKKNKTKGYKKRKLTRNKRR